MFNTNMSLYNRQFEKTPEQVFINSLRKEYQLSLAEPTFEGALDYSVDIV